jgi:DNA-binding transcriptional MocR family regulator
MLPIRFSGRRPLVAQLEAQMRQLIETGYLRPGTRAPSVRQFAADLGISTFTVANAYDRLVAANYLVSRRARGYFVAEKKLDNLSDPELREGSAIDALWLIRTLRAQGRDAIRAGAGILPSEWIDGAEFQRCARAALRSTAEGFMEYPSLLGHRPLRDMLALKLIEQGISVQTEQIVLTSGASHALDLALRVVVAPGDTLLVEEPCFYALFAQLRQMQIPFATVPRNADGLDLEALESTVRQHKPKAILVNSVLHNPTGGTLATHNAHRILSIAEEYDMQIIEDDIYGDFYEGRSFRLANLDQLKRVAYIGGFSKTVAASLRVGFIAANRNLAHRLGTLKLSTCLATPDLNERVIYELLASGSYRRQMERVRQRLTGARRRVISRLQALGFELALVPDGGFFLWARTLTGHDALSMAKDAAQIGLVLAPGPIFSPNGGPSTWVRFNAAHCDTDAFAERLATLLV